MQAYYTKFFRVPAASKTAVRIGPDIFLTVCRREMGFRLNQESIKRCDMNNRNLKTLLVAALACTAFCGTTLAAPHRGSAAPRNDRAAHTAPARKTTHHPAPAAVRHPAPARHHAAPAPSRHLAPPRYVHHAPPPPPPRPATVVVAREEPGLLAAGACLLGAVFGAVLGAAF